MKKEDFDYDLKATGQKGSLYLIGNKIRLDHKIVIFGATSKDISIDTITAIKFIEAGIVVEGYIEFSFAADKNYLAETNIVFFNKVNNDEFIKIKKEIEKRWYNPVQDIQEESDR